MRRWLLAIVGILLVADGYWASRNLVLKSQDEPIHWFLLQPMGSQVKLIDKDAQTSDTLTWNGSNWVKAGLAVHDVRSFIQYWKDYPDGDPFCQISFSIDKNLSVSKTLAAIESAHQSGAATATILLPVEIVGRPEVDDTGLWFWTSLEDAGHCPHAKQWKKHLGDWETGIGFPPSEGGLSG